MNPSQPQNPDKPPLQSPAAAPISQVNTDIPKRGQISINKAFLIIHAAVLTFILVIPIVFLGDDTILGTLTALFNGGFLLILLVIALHVFFLWREKKRKN
jgi:hypothetical protein